MKWKKIGEPIVIEEPGHHFIKLLVQLVFRQKFRKNSIQAAIRIRGDDITFDQQIYHIIPTSLFEDTTVNFKREVYIRTVKKGELHIELMCNYKCIHYVSKWSERSK